MDTYLQERVVDTLLALCLTLGSWLGRHLKLSKSPHKKVVVIQIPLEGYSSRSGVGSWRSSILLKVVHDGWSDGDYHKASQAKIFFFCARLMSRNWARLINRLAMDLVPLIELFILAGMTRLRTSPAVY